MSETALRDRELEAARRQLTGRGYLAGALPDAPPKKWRLIAEMLAFSVFLALVLGLAEAGFAGQDLSLALPLTLGFLPAAVVATLSGIWLARRGAAALLRLGGEPGAIATAVAVVAAAAVLSAMAAIGKPTVPGIATVPGLVGGLLAALVAMRWTRRQLLSSLSYPTPPPEPRSLAGATFIAVLAVGVVGVLFLAQRAVAPVSVAAEAFPPPQGRVAVIAVDGLSREDLEAAADLTGAPSLREAVLWGWAALEPQATPLPIVFWTTVACGVPPASHGVTVYEEVRLFGMERGVPMSRFARAVVGGVWQRFGMARVLARPALIRHKATVWEMASRAGSRVTVGGWWGSWPVRRVLGEIVSERAWLGGGIGEDAVTPGMEGMVTKAWEGGGRAADVSDALAVALVESSRGRHASHLMVVALPALDIERRADPAATPLALAQRQLPHYGTVDRVLTLLGEEGYSVWVLAVPWGAGTGFVSSSTAATGKHAAFAGVELAATVLDQLGLPCPVELPPPRRDLSAADGAPCAPAEYGPPPPALAAPSPGGQRVQRELLRNLGYLQ